jgi:hypothetical protein
MKAVLFTLFASGYVQDTIVPRLAARGVRVQRVMEPRRAQNTTITEDLVLFMHEFGPHSNDRIVREAAKTQNKRFQYLSRKAGVWPEDLYDATDLPPGADGRLETTALPADRLDNCLRHVVACRDSGQSYDVIAPALAKFWRAGEVAPGSGGELRRYLERVREAGEPNWFLLWKPAPAPAAPPATPEPSAPDESDAELLTLFEADNAKLSERVRELEGQVDVRGQDQRRVVAERDTARKELASALDEVGVWKGEYETLRQKHARCEDAWNAQGAALESRDATVQELRKQLESARLIPKGRAPNGLGKMLAQVRPLVPSILSAEEALERLAAYAAKE